MHSFRRYRTLALLFASLGMLSAMAQGRSQKDLSGMWDFRFDPDGVGEAQKWYAPATAGEWQKAKVPGSYNEEFAAHPLMPDVQDGKRFYKGAAWYRTSVDVSPAAGEDEILHLEGTVLRQKVWVNGKLAGQSAIPYMDVAYTITPLLHAGRNTIVVEVDNSVLAHSIPDAKWKGWWDDGGLIRPVVLETRPQTRSDSHYTTTMLPGGGWKLDVASHVVSPGRKGVELSFALRDAEGKVVWQARKHGAADGGDVTESAVLHDVAPWSPEHPVLYRMEVRTTTESAVADVDSMHVGFRDVRVDGTRVLLNGEPLQLRGINRHEFLAGAGMSLTPAQNRKDIADIKHIGANFTRLAHYSQSQEVYDACDELGLLVWTEIPAWQTAAETLSSEQTWENDLQPQLRAMVEQHRNHPSVMIYSVANEIPTDKMPSADYVKRAIAYVHSLDSARLVTFASDKRERDLALGYVDVIAVNEYFGWYYGGIHDVGAMLDMMHQRFPDKPIMVSEYGSEAVAGWDASKALPDKQGMVKNYSLQYQVELLTAHMQQIYATARQNFVLGGVIWVYADFPDPHRVGGDHPDAARYRNTKGLVTLDRRPKPSYTAVEAFFHQLQSQHAAEGTDATAAKGGQ